MIVSGFALYVLLQTFSGVEEFIPQVYSDVEGCAAAEREYMKRSDYVDGDCAYRSAIKVSKPVKEVK